MPNSNINVSALAEYLASEIGSESASTYMAIITEHIKKNPTKKTKRAPPSDKTMQCMGRTWAGGMGAQCIRPRCDGDFCKSHAKVKSDDGEGGVVYCWEKHGRVDKPPPPGVFDKAKTKAKATINVSIPTPTVSIPMVSTPSKLTTPTPTPTVETPKETTPKETTKVDTPKEEATKVEAPKVETPKVETTKVETPKAETPKVETPKETTKVETTKVETTTKTTKAKTKTTKYPKPTHSDFCPYDVEISGSEKTVVLDLKSGECYDYDIYNTKGRLKPVGFTLDAATLSTLEIEDSDSDSCGEEEECFGSDSE